MKVHLTPEAKGQLNLFRRLENTGTGFLLGNEIGKHILVRNMIPIVFNEENISKIYQTLLQHYNEKLIGVFFKEENYFLCDWFVGDIILNYTDVNLNFYHYDFEKNMTAYTIWEAK